MPLPPASARSRPRLLVSLAEAREQALTKRKLARSGGNPLAEKRRAEGMHTFADASRRVLDQKRGGWRGRWHAQNWLPASNATRSRALDPSTVGRPSDIDDLGLHAVDVMFEVELGHQVFTASDGTRGGLGELFLDVGCPERVIDLGDDLAHVFLAAPGRIAGRSGP